MNKKGICFFFGYSLKHSDTPKMIKNHGFDCIITIADKNLNWQNGSIKQQVKNCKKNNLELSSLHMTYFGKDLKKFWTQSKDGDILEKNLIKDVKTAHKYGFNCVVVHLEGGPNQIGYDRIKRVLKYCEKYKIPLALENIGKFKTLKATFDNVKSDYLKFCFDIGHQNCLEPQIDNLSYFGNKLIALHLHSNMGNADEHTLNKYGNIDWDSFARRLAKINPTINLDYEIVMCTRHCEKPEDVLSEVYKQACELEKMIEKYSNNK